MRVFKIGEIAKMAQVSIETVRYYERQGLLPHPPRRESGYRQFPQESVNRLKFIKRAQELGFSLKEIADLLSLRVMCDTTCGDIKRLAERKILEVEMKIQGLNTIKAALTGLVGTCHEDRQAEECPILMAFDN